MVDDNKEVQRKTKVLGTEEESQGLLARLDAKFPEIAAMAKEKEISDRQRFTTLKKEFDVLWDMEKKRMEIVKLNPKADEDEFNIRPEVAKQLNTLQGQITSLVKGPDEEEVNELLRQNPERIDLGGDFSLTEQEIFDAMANPQELSSMVSNLNEMGLEASADRLSEVVAFNLQQPTLSNVIQVPPQTAPQGSVPPLEDPNLVGQSISPTQNIKNNIREFLQGARTGGAVTGAGEQVKEISSSLKRARANRKEQSIVAGSLA